MKKICCYLLAAAAVVSGVSCQKDELRPIDETRVVTFEVSFADDDSKTSYQGSGKVDWVEGDNIRYYTKKNGAINEYEVVRSGHSTKLLAEITAGTSYVIAAYGGTGITDNGETSFTLNGVVKASQSGKFEDAHVSVAKTFDIVDGSSLSFHNMTSLIKFSLERTDAAYVIFKATAGEKLHGNGTLYVTFSDDQPSVAFGEGGDSEIRVNTNGAGTFYISTLPVKMSQGFTLTLYNASGKFLAVAEQKTPVTIEKNVVYNLGVLDSHAIVPATGITLSETQLTLEQGTSATLSATVLPINASDKSVSWSSSDSKVAIVDENGVVTAVGTGNCTITAATKNGLKAECKIYVLKVVTKDASEVGCKGATLNGTFNVSGAESVSKSVFFLYSDTESTLEGLKANGIKVTSSLSGSEFKSSVNNLKSDTKHYYVAAVTFTGQTYYGDVKNFTTSAIPEGAVDLGLSVLWATCNIGASKPADYGDYYAWGEIETKDDYSWPTYKWCKGSYDTLTKYNTDSSCGTVDNKTVLEPEDDVAHVKLGGKWRMPTAEEWDELIENCTWEWTTIGGVKGRLVTSKKTGYTNKSIFLPAAGYRHYTDLNYVGSYGNYWSPSLYTDSSYRAWRVFFDSGNVGKFGYDRCSGRSVRAVSE